MDKMPCVSRRRTDLHLRARRGAWWVALLIAGCTTDVAVNGLASVRGAADPDAGVEAATQDAAAQDDAPRGGAAQDAGPLPQDGGMSEPEPHDADVVAVDAATQAVTPCTGGAAPTAEQCNAVDDDCDLIVDEDVASLCVDADRVQHCQAGSMVETSCDGVLQEQCGAPGTCVGTGLQVLGERDVAGAVAIDTANLSLWVTRVVNGGPKSVDVRQLCVQAASGGYGKGVMYLDDNGVPGALLLRAALGVTLEQDTSACYHQVGGAQIAPGQAVWMGAQFDGPLNSPSRVYATMLPEGDSYWTSGVSPSMHPPDIYPLASPNTTHLSGTLLSFFAVVFPLED
jgi:hypothetical protein